MILLINPLQKFLNNPVAIKLTLLGVICISMFLLAAIVIRKMRQEITAESTPAQLLPESSPAFGAVAYSSVIQQLREKEKDLLQQREKEQQRAATAEIIHEAMLANLSCGVVFFDRLGTVRQANKAAKSLLGYASPLMFNVRDLFRTVTKVRWPGDEANSPTPLVGAIQQTIRDASAFSRVAVEYRTPSGQKRTLGISAFAVVAKDSETLGACCLIDDLTEITELGREMQRAENLASMGEISAGLVRDFKNSLETISGQAQMLQRGEAGESTRKIAEKIMTEAESLSRVVAEFLEFASSPKN
jgi:nitrogen fixation/metabolism regulation signal transduction histidine kinase